MSWITHLLPLNVELQAPGRWPGLPQDASVNKVLDRLDALGNGAVSGQDLLDLLGAATDYGALSSQEWRTIRDWVRHNFQKLSPEAERIFTKLDEVIQAKGLFASISARPVLSGDDLSAVMGQLPQLLNLEPASPDRGSAPPGDPLPTTTAPLGGDDSAERALESLINKRGMISGAELLEAIREGTADLDAQAAGRELDLFTAFERTDGHRFASSAREIMAIYERHAQAAHDAGQTGIDQDDWQAMIGEMEAASSGSGSGARPLATSPASADLPARAAGAGADEGGGSRTPAASGTSSTRATGKGDLATRAGETAADVKELTDQIASLDPNSPTYHRDLFTLQQKLHNAQEKLQILTQMIKALHDMNMAVIQNIRT
jgi:hypothetical protein